MCLEAREQRLIVPALERVGRLNSSKMSSGLALWAYVCFCVIHDVDGRRLFFHLRKQSHSDG